MIRAHAPAPALAGLFLFASLVVLPGLASAQTTYTIDSLGEQPNQQNNASCVSTAGTCALRNRSDLTTMHPDCA